MQLNNKLNLDMRLRELVEQYSIPSVSNLIGDTEVFIRQVKNTRNYLTHFDPKGKKECIIWCRFSSTIYKTATFFNRSNSY